jgi:plasmid maintenance system antidote protein VapI
MLGRKQIEVAQALGVDSKYLHDVMAGRTISAPFVARLAKLLDAEPSELQRPYKLVRQTNGGYRLARIP